MKQAMAADFERLVEQVAQAMNAAQDGRIIADTEEPVRQAHADAMMALASLYHSGLWDTYWKSARAAA